MVRRFGLTLAFAVVASAAQAQGPECRFFKVDTGLLNVSTTAGGTQFVDVLEHGEVVCVTREATANERAWGFIAHRSTKPGTTIPVDGWGAMALLKSLSPAESAAFGSKPAAPNAGAVASPVPAAPAAAPKAAALAAAQPAPKTSAPPPPAAAKASTQPSSVLQEEILRFDQPVPFGPFPVNGRSLQELAAGVPMFPPLEGLPEELWKKECATCHKWNKARLCDQGATYVKAARNVLRHQHPYGGAYKVALMRWAKTGCK